MSRSLLSLALAALFFSVPAAYAAKPAPISPDQGEVAIVQKPSALPQDWTQGPFIEIYVRGYKDSNGDGHGDLKGVVEKLDYIKSLGYTGIWLMPIYTSEDKNHGYAVKNYREVEPRYGKLEDLHLLLNEAHKRGIGVILDYVINHSSDRHPLFIASGKKDNPYRDWFVWQNGDKPEGWSGLNGESWYGGTEGWYYAVFWERMPDFNLKNPEVLDFHLNNMKYWLNQGVDGFRIDAVAYLVENNAIGWENQPENYKIMRRVQDLLAQYESPRYMVCEATTDAPGFASENGCGSAFAFGLQKAILKSVRFGRVDRDLTAYLEKNPINRMATFLTNHDAFAGLRLYNQLGGDLKAYRLAAATQYLLPGVPYTLYGEEIGMDLATGAGGQDEQIRAPMPWTGEDRIKEKAQAGAVQPAAEASAAEASAADAADAKTGEQAYYTWAGFTKLEPAKRRKMFRPLPDNWEKFNVAAEDKDADSLLNFYRQLIHLRKNSAPLRSGVFRLVSAQQPAVADAPGKGKKAKAAKPVWQDDVNVLAFVRDYNGEKVLVAINYAETEHAVRVDLGQKVVTRLNPLWPQSPDALQTGADGKVELKVPGSGFVVFKLN